MFVEALDHETRSRIFERFFAETSAALIQVFGKGELEASQAIDDLRRRFSDAPKQEQDLLLHEDPVVLAGELAEVAWSDIDEQQLNEFNARRRAELAEPDPAAR